MEEIDHLTKQVAQLTEQVRLLSQSVELMVNRSEQLFKMQEERLNVLPQLATHLSGAIDEIETTNQALLDSLDEQDSAIDELKKATAAQLLIVQRMTDQKGENGAS